MKRYIPPDGLADKSEIQNYRDQIERFENFASRFHTHPGFGYYERKELERVYAAHASHHLSFLIPKTELEFSSNEF